MADRIRKSLVPFCQRFSQRKICDFLSTYICRTGFEVFPYFRYFKSGIAYFMLLRVKTCSEYIFKVRNYCDGFNIAMFNLFDLKRERDRIALERRKVKKEL